MRPQFLKEENMFSADKIQRGAARFVDVEILPNLEGKDKWIVSGIATLYLSRLPALIQQAKQSPAVKLAGVISEDGMVDIESILNGVRPAARQTPAVINIPMGGSLRFTEQDLDTLFNYIKNA